MKWQSHLLDFYFCLFFFLNSISNLASSIEKFLEKKKLNWSNFVFRISFQAFPSTQVLSAQFFRLLFSFSIIISCQFQISQIDTVPMCNFKFLRFYFLIFFFAFAFAIFVQLKCIEVYVLPFLFFIYHSHSQSHSLSRYFNLKSFHVFAVFFFFIIYMSSMISFSRFSK